MSKFTDQQATQTNLLTLIMLQDGSAGENGFMGLLAIGMVLALPFWFVPAAICRKIDRMYAKSSTRAKLLAELCLYESSEICNSYSHIEIAKLKQRLSELS